MAVVEQQQSHREWTFEQVGRAACAVATRLKQSGLRAGQPVPFKAGNGIGFHALDLGILMAGGVPACLPDGMDDEALGPLAGSDCVVTYEGFATQRHLRITREELITGCSYEEPMPAAAAGDACIVFTSGSTGSPRGVLLGQRELIAGIEHWCRMWPSGEPRHRRVLSYLPMSHVAERIMAHYLLCLYGTTVVVGSVANLAEDICSLRPDILFGVPRIWSRLVEALPRPGLVDSLQRLELGLNGGALLASATSEALARHGITVSNAYGMTETTVPAFLATEPGDSLGLAVGVRHRIAANGELLIASPWPARGYVERWPTVTPVTDAEGWVHTGDLAEPAAAGVRLVGRLSALMKTTRGEYLNPEPIEAHLTAQDQVESACVALIDESVNALVSIPESVSWPRSKLLARQEELADGLRKITTVRPDRLTIVAQSWGADLHTPTGKVARSKITARYAGRLKPVIAFDLGGVFFAYSFRRAIDAWAALSGTDAAGLERRFSIDEPFDRFERGEVTTEQYLAHLSKTLDCGLTASALADGWNRIYGEVNSELVTLINEASSAWYPIGVSNTNELHALVWRELYRAELGALRRVYCSHELGVTKPARQFFEAIAADLHVRLDDITIVDDMPVVVETAQKFGMPAHLYRSMSELRSYLAERASP